MIDNCIAIASLHYQKRSMRIFTITAYIQLFIPSGTTLGANVRADHEDELPKYKDLYRRAESCV